MAVVGVTEAIARAALRRFTDRTSARAAREHPSSCLSPFRDTQPSKVVVRSRPGPADRCQALECHPP